MALLSLATPDRTRPSLARILSGFGELVLDIPCRQHANPLLLTTWTTSVTIKRTDDACQEMLQKWSIFEPRQVPLWCRARFELDQTLWITGSRHIRTAFLSLGCLVLSIITLNINQSCEKMDNFDWSRDVVTKRSSNECLLSPLTTSKPFVHASIHIKVNSVAQSLLYDCIGLVAPHQTSWVEELDVRIESFILHWDHGLILKNENFLAFSTSRKKSITFFIN